MVGRYVWKNAGIDKEAVDLCLSVLEETDHYPMEKVHQIKNLIHGIALAEVQLRQVCDEIIDLGALHIGETSSN